MYTEETNKGRHGFPVKDFLIKLVLIIIFVLLLMWLFPMPNMKPFYDSVFRNNINEMKEVAKDYYTNERLPKNVGDTVKITLKEMEDMSLILPFVDKDGNYCDKTASYVEVTRLDTEYKMTVTLSCPSGSNHIVEFMGCYDKCPNGCTTETKPTPTTNKRKVTYFEYERYNYEYQRPKIEYKRTSYEYERYTSNDSWSAYSAWTTEYKEETNDLRRIERTLVKGKKYVEKTSTIEKWSDWSSWSAWSAWKKTKASISNTDTLQVEFKSKTEKEYSGYHYSWTDTKTGYFSYRISSTTTRKVLSCSPSTHAACGGTCSSWTYVYKCSYQDRYKVNEYDYVKYYSYHTRSRHRVTETVTTGEWVYTDFMLEKDLPEGYIKTGETLKQYAYSTRTSNSTRETKWSYETSITGWSRTGNFKDELKWSYETTLTGWVQTGKKENEKTWSYEASLSGWTKTGNSKRETTWSSASSLPGWSRTGKSVVKEITY